MKLNHLATSDLKWVNNMGVESTVCKWKVSLTGKCYNFPIHIMDFYWMKICPMKIHGTWRRLVWQKYLSLLSSTQKNFQA